ncbi:MAG: hypothetical protein RJB66_1865 [Pseudomonadota bacterium]|jgi:hypothetical protein
MNHSIEIVGSILFCLAVLHTFSVKYFHKLGGRFREGSVGENFFHLMSEVEVVFGLWSLFFFLAIAYLESFASAQSYLDSRNFTEPLFVFAVMVVASTKPVIDFATSLIELIAKTIPLPKYLSFYGTCLIVGPLLGSLITEPAAMTVTSMILLERVYQQKMSDPFKYATLGLLFVNISIGGTLTHFAAPPVVMVASTWGWDTLFMLNHFGWKAAIAVVLSTIFVLVKFSRELKGNSAKTMSKPTTPIAMSLLHIVFLALIVMTSHHPKLFMSLLLFFLGFATVTKEYQSQLKIREGLLVGFFLGGLVTIGGAQVWWVQKVIMQLNSWSLYLASTGLTAIFDNAALTYLGSLVPGISDMSKYALVAGAVVGGGLTVIANAPNPIGYGILNSRFGKDGINPLLLLKAGLVPTLIAAACFWFL